MKLAPPTTAKGIIDSHAHVMKEYFKDEQNAVIDRAYEHKVHQMVNPAVTVEDLDELKELSQKYDFLFFALGQHPHDAKDWKDEYEGRIIESAREKKMVAVGECGLDFFYKNSSKETQLEVFRKQIKIAKQIEKPIIVHCRDAWQEAIDLLAEEKDDRLRGVFHCFTGGPELIDPIKNKLDFYISFSGILTFKNAKEIQEAAKLVAADRMLVETDCPFLAPQKVRGERNEPAFVWWTAEKLAELKNCDLEDVAIHCSNNARQLFNLPQL